MLSGRERRGINETRRVATRRDEAPPCSRARILPLFPRVVNNISGQTLSIAVKIVKVLRSHPPVASASVCVHARALLRGVRAQSLTSPHRIPHPPCSIYSIFLAGNVGITEPRALVDGNVRCSTFLHFPLAISASPLHPHALLPAGYHRNFLYRLFLPAWRGAARRWLTIG